MIRSLHNGRRPPQRSRTTHENIPAGPQVVTFTRVQAQAQAQQQQPRYHTPTPPAAHKEEEREKAQSASIPAPQQQQQEAPDSLGPLTQHPRRPKLGAPRRSYSVMDYEPVPPEQRPASGPLTFSTLPPELHYAIFDFLDPIDATCLGLANKHLYAIHQRMHGSVPLSVQRDGPNELEWAWHRAAYPKPATLLNGCPSDGEQAGAHLAALRVRGKGLCRKCGVNRCELHKHIVEWMPAGYEYCSVRDRFVPRPGDDARLHCYMSNPTNRSRCGRHRVRRADKEAVTP